MLNLDYRISTQTSSNIFFFSVYLRNMIEIDAQHFAWFARELSLSKATRIEVDGQTHDSLARVGESREETMCVCSGLKRGSFNLQLPSSRLVCCPPSA